MPWKREGALLMVGVVKERGEAVEESYPSMPAGEGRRASR